MNWDDAYANGAHIPGAVEYPPRWEAEAAAFRAALGSRAKLGVAYGDHARQVYDLFLPESAPRGLAVFVHGGYWMKFGCSTWSHLAGGALAAGWAMALPQYTLCPEVHISDITAEIGQAIRALAAQVDRPIHLAGHSAGGHLVTRMVCQDSPLPETVRNRIAHVLSISGVHDLRPLLQTQMNEGLRLDMAEAIAESPALQIPDTQAPITCWVGADERPEFVRQNALLANIWTGFGIRTQCIEEPDRHHFDVIDSLAEPNSEMVRTWLKT